MSSRRGGGPAGADAEADARFMRRALGLARRAGRATRPNPMVGAVIVRGGQVIGKTDELGLNVVEDKTHVHDLHATMLHLLGIEHKKLTYRFNGRDMRLTDVYGELIPQIVA